MTPPSHLIILMACLSLLHDSTNTVGARSIGGDVPLLHAKFEGFSNELGKGNFDDVDMKERYVFKDQDDLLEYIRELQRRYSLLVGRPRFGRSVRSFPRTSGDYLF